MKKIIFILCVNLLLVSCQSKSGAVEKKESHRADTIVSQRTFSIDSTTGVFAGAVRGKYLDKKGRYGYRSKLWTLFDKDGHNIFTLGIAGNCFVAAKREFDAKGEISGTYILISENENCFDDPERFYKNDTLLLQSVVMVAQSKWKAIQDSGKN